MILILNGAFGIGKSTVARHLVRRLPGCVIYDPELFGIALQRAGRLMGLDVQDFQDLRVWRIFTILALRIIRLFSANIVVPMAISKPSYLSEIRAKLMRFEPRVVHVCLVAPPEVVHERLQKRGATPDRNSWEYVRASECCAIHPTADFAEHIAAAGPIQHVVEDVLTAVRRSAPEHATRFR